MMCSFFYSEKMTACPGEIKTTHEMEDTFELFGMLLNRSSDPSGYFVAWKSESYVRIVYKQRLPEIKVLVYSESGNPVYKNITVPIPGDELFIDISNWSEGTYTIVFENDSGPFLFGIFQKPGK